MDEQKYTLTWHTYQDHLRGMMKNMITSEDFADVTLVTDDKQTVKAHRNILSACSSVFKDILQMETPNNHPVIYLRGIQYPEIESILQFMYLGEAKFYEERMDEFVMVAINLGIKELNKVDDSNHDNTSVQSGMNCEEQTEEFRNIENNEEKDAVITLNEEDDSAQELETKNPVSDKSKFQCTRCDKTFSAASGLWHHEKAKHEGVKYACNQCDQQFTAPSGLTMHIKSKQFTG